MKKILRIVSYLLIFGIILEILNRRKAQNVALSTKSELTREIDYPFTIKEVVEALGGLKNANYSSHTLNKVKFNLNDMSLLDLSTLKKITNPKGTFKSNSSISIIIGPYAKSVSDDFNKIKKASA